MEIVIPATIREKETGDKRLVLEYCDADLRGRKRVEDIHIMLARMNRKLLPPCGLRKQLPKFFKESFAPRKLHRNAFSLGQANVIPGLLVRIGEPILFAPRQIHHRNLRRRRDGRKIVPLRRLPKSEFLHRIPPYSFISVMFLFRSRGVYAQKNRAGLFCLVLQRLKTVNSFRPSGHFPIFLPKRKRILDNKRPGNSVGFAPLAPLQLLPLC